MNNMVEKSANVAEKSFNVAQTSSNGHFVNTDVVQLKNLNEAFVVKAKEGQKVNMKSANHGNLSLTKKKGRSLCVFHQDDIDELGGVIRARRD